MANLGTLWFDSRLQNTAVKDAEQIKKDLLTKLGKSVDLTIKPEIDKSEIRKSLQKSLDSFKPKVKVDVVVDRATATQALKEAMLKAGVTNSVSAGMLRAARMAKVQQEMEDRHAESLLRQEAAHNRASRAASRHTAAQVRLNTQLSHGINIGGKLSSTIAGIYTIGTFVRMLSQVIRIGGEFEKQRIALETMLGSLAKADAMYERMKGLAVESPFTFMDLMSYTKQLKAFQIPYNELYDTTKRLGDISAGLGVSMDRIILAYGQVRSAAFLRGQEVRQFSEAGIPLLDALAKKFSVLENRIVSVGEVFDKISKRQVSFQMVKDVMWDLTNEGGQFYNMQARLTESLSGKLDKLRDSYEIALASFAQGNHGILGTVLDMFTKMAGHLDTLINLLGTATFSFIAFKAGMTILKWAKDVRTAVLAISAYQHATKAAAAAQYIWNASIAANPLGFALAAIVAVVGTIVTFTDGVKSAEEATRELNAAIQKTNDEAEEADQKAQDYIHTMFDETRTIGEKQRAYEQLQKIYPEMFSNMDYEQAKRKGNIKLLDMETQAARDNARAKLQSMLIEHKAKLDEARSWSTGNAWQWGQATPQEKAETIKAEEDAVEKLTKALSDLDKVQKRVDTNRASGWWTGAKKIAGASEYAPKETETWDDYFDRIDQDLSKARSRLNKMTSGAEGYQALKDDVDKLQQIWDLLGGKRDKKHGGGTPTRSDTELEHAKTRLDALKAFMAEYKKFKDIYKDKGKAIAFTEELFPDLKGKGADIVNNYTSLLEKIAEIPQTTDARKKFATSVKKLISEWKIDDIKKEADRALREMQDYIAQAGSKYDLYKSLFEKTGNKDFAKAAFSDGRIWDEATQEMAVRLQEGMEKNKLEGVAPRINWNTDAQAAEEYFKANFKNGESLYELWKKIVELTGKNWTDALNQSADAQADIMNNAQKIAILEDKILKAKQDTSGIDHAAEIAKWKEEINRLKSELFELTPIYEKIFGDRTYASYGAVKEAEQAARDLIKNAAVGQRDPKTGKVSYFTSFYMDGNEKKEVTLTRQQLERLKNTLDGYHKDEQQKNPFATLISDIKNLSKVMKNKDSSPEAKVAAWKKFASTIGEVGDIVGNFAGQLSSMFDALGNESLADAMSDVQAAMGSMSNIAKGFSQGGIVGGIVAAAGEAVGWIGRIAQRHDKKLDKAIQASQREVKKLQNAYKNLEWEISQQLTGITKEQSREMIRNLEIQQEELKKQLAAEEDKKKDNKDKIIDYQQQIVENAQKLATFYEDLGKDRYGLDIDSWASDLANVIVDAFASGEDAAEAFDRKVADIMKNVVSNMIKISVVKPAMEGLQQYLFGKNGIATTDSEGGVEITEGEAQGLIGQLVNLKNTIGTAQRVWDAVENAARMAGVDLAGEGGSSEGQNVIHGDFTEQETGLLLSYVNAIRADVSMNRIDATVYYPQYIELLTRGNVLAETQMQLQGQIAANTLRNAEAAEAIQDILHKATLDKAYGFSVK